MGRWAYYASRGGVYGYNSNQCFRTDVSDRARHYWREDMRTLLIVSRTTVTF